MKTPTLAKLTVACTLATSLLFVSCTKENNGYYNYPYTAPYFAPSVQIHLTSTASTNDFTAVNLDIRAIEYNTSGEAGTTYGWEAVNLEHAGPVNMLTLMHGNSIQVSSYELLPAEVKQIRLHLGDHSTIDKNGVTHPLVVPESVRDYGIVVYPEIEADGNVNPIYMNFDVSNSIAHDTNTDTYTLYPSFSTFDASKTGTIEGYVTPTDAHVSVLVHSDSNNRVPFQANILSDSTNQGYFRIIGIPEGYYNIELIAGDGSNRSKVIYGVEVLKTGLSNVGQHDLQ